MAKRVKSSKFLPFHLINDNILPRFPVKSLVRFTSVCKTWGSLIKSPDFFASHLKLNNRQEYSFILKGKSSYTIQNQMPVIFDKLGSMSGCTLSDDYPAESCNGLILLKVEKGNFDEYLLWNPSIKKSKTIESFYPSYSKSRYQLRGLGFCESNNDYRVVKLMYRVEFFSLVGDPNDYELCIQAEIYSLQTDSWLEVDSKVPNGLVGFNGGVFLDGRVHWLATRDCDFIIYRQSSPHDDSIESILFFDFERECFGEIQLPDFDHNGSKLVGFHEFQGKLSAVFFDLSVDKCFVWVMGEYGVTESWTNQLIISIPKNICGSPVGFTNGMVVCKLLRSIACSNKRQTRSLKTRKEVSGLILLGNGKLKEPVNVVDYMESLALLDR